jgi:hypothetical protein
MKKIWLLVPVFMSSLAFGNDITLAKGTSTQGTITVRTEHHPRPPYSEATYYIYERDNKVICTKVQVCDKYDRCMSDYKLGAYHDTSGDDNITYQSTTAVAIPQKKLRKHLCLTKFSLLRSQ